MGEFRVEEGNGVCVTAEERASQAIIKLIIDHRYLPGEKLLETDLAHELGMSRTPIRSALRKLAAEGFLEMQANKGCSVPFLTLEDMETLFNFRAELEGIAAYEAACAIGEGEIEAIKKLLEREKDIYGQSDVLMYNKVNEKIHRSIVNASGNNYLIRAAMPIFLRSELYIFYYDRYCREKAPKREYLETPEAHRSIIEHGKLLRSLIEKEADIARIISKRHVLATMEQLRKTFSLTGTKVFSF